MAVLKAFFENMGKAVDARKSLKEKGYHSVYLDMIDAFDSEYSSELSILNNGSQAVISETDEKCYSSRLCANIPDSDFETVIKVIRGSGGRIFEKDIE